MAIHKPNIGSETNSLIAAITSDYNTGYMIGDIKGAFLSDTDTTNVTGTYLYFTDFSSNDKGFTFADNGSDGVDSGVMTIANNGSARATDSNALTGVATGTKLLVKFTVTFGGTGQLNLDDDGSGAGVGGNTNLVIASKSGSGTQTFSAIYTKTASDRVRFIRSSGGNFQIDNFEMKILPEDDRSVKNNGLAVYGTITKSPVATGAELVAYSGWSDSNYIQQPYNSDLDFGSGNWSFNFWVNPNDSSQGSVLMSRWSKNMDDSTAGRIGIYFNSGNVRFDLTDDGASSYQAITGTNGIQDTTGWHMVNILRRGNNAEMWVDGKLDVSTALTSTSNGSYTNSNAILEIGDSDNMGSPDSEIQLALIRISATAPSAEQIKKMYNEEKCLFHENAKCTLYGTSNAVTALAYDDTTNILHVGTSAGRSDFRGLNRINNTTTAVTTAISASNKLVAEQ